MFDYVCCTGTPESILGFAELFCPTLLVYEGRHYLASRFGTDAYVSWKEKGTNPKEIQRVMNHVHVSSLLQQQEVSDALANEVVRVLSTIWALTLRDSVVIVQPIETAFEDAAVTLYDP